MKQWWQSKTILGALVVLISAVAGHFGLKVSDDDQQQLLNAFSALGEVVGSLVVIWGRVTATKGIGKPDPNVLGVVPLVFCAFLLPGCVNDKAFRISTFQDGLAAAETGLASAYDSIAIAKRNGYIDDAKKVELIAKVDEARTLVRTAQAGPGQDWNSLQSAQAILRALQTTLLELQNGQRTQGNSGNPSATRSGFVSGRAHRFAAVDQGQGRRRGSPDFG